MAKNITLWSSYSCQLCTDIKEYFGEQNISYTNKDMKANPELRDQLEEKYQVRKAPVIEVDNEVVIGAGKFNEEDWTKLKQLVKEKEVTNNG
ncbi:glutaredoxin family protein [Bacillus tianshenii]|nr:glutaredoxin family protein [Bacillus tianshenii]